MAGVGGFLYVVEMVVGYGRCGLTRPTSYQKVVGRHYITMQKIIFDFQPRTGTSSNINNRNEATRNNSFFGVLGKAGRYC